MRVRLTDEEAGEVSELRTSSTAFLGGEALAFHPTLVAVQKRASAFSGGLPWTHAECLQLVSYTSGQRFATHVDYFEHLDGQTERNGGQRLFSGLVYLNDGSDGSDGSNGGEFEGGATTFPTLNLTFVPKKGTMLFWRNVDQQMAPGAVVCQIEAPFYARFGLS